MKIGKYIDRVRFSNGWRIWFCGCCGSVLVIILVVFILWCCVIWVLRFWWGIVWVMSFFIFWIVMFGVFCKVCVWVWLSMVWWLGLRWSGNIWYCWGKKWRSFLMMIRFFLILGWRWSLVIFGCMRRSIVCWVELCVSVRKIWSINLGFMRLSVMELWVKILKVFELFLME